MGTVQGGLRQFPYLAEKQGEGTCRHAPAHRRPSSAQDRWPDYPPRHRAPNIGPYRLQAQVEGDTPLPAGLPIAFRASGLDRSGSCRRQSVLLHGAERSAGTVRPDGV